MNKRLIVPLIGVSLLANIVLAGLLLFGPRGLFRSEASEPGQTSLVNTRTGTVVGRDGLILSLLETDAAEIAVIVLPNGTPVRKADETGAFVPADEARLGENDLVQLTYLPVGEEQVLQSVDILEDK